MNAKNLIKLSPRQTTLLKLIIEDYIANAKPLASNNLLTNYKLDYSSATIRNEMFELEDMGLIYKPHFASGRIPTNKGYKYYVDNLMKDKNQFSELKNQLSIIFSNRANSIDQTIEKACNAISSLINLPVVNLKSSKNDNLKRIELIQLDNKTLLGLVITSSGQVFSKHYNISESTFGIADLIKCINFINERLTNTPLKLVKDQLKLLEPILKQQIKAFNSNLHDFLYNLFSFDQSTSPHIFGVAKIASHEEFNDVKKIKDILEILENNSIWEQIDQTAKLEQNHNKITFGEELSDKLNDVALITADYESNETSGRLAIIGPTRMDYQSLKPFLGWITEKINEKEQKERD